MWQILYAPQMVQVWVGTWKQIPKISDVEDVFLIDEYRVISMLKVSVMQAMIQIERHTGWRID